ncbi:unnamed protein product [Amoebophrya sp. A120]|nr:unnamed protein product [Amoebophrya sp. A120]|eukprot:GSA120T00021367001.1
MKHFFRTVLAVSALSTHVDAKARKAKIGMADTIRGTCVNPPQEADLRERVEYGDKIEIKLSAYTDNPESKDGLEYSVDKALQTITVGRANVPVLNEMTLGMCPNEIRRIMTWINPKHKIGPLAYMVEVVKIVAKKALQAGGPGGFDEL